MVGKQIEKLLSNKKIINEIKIQPVKTDIYFATTFVGEVIKYCLIHSSRKDIKSDEVVTYIRGVKDVMYEYRKIENETERSKYIQNERSKLIISSIAKSLGLESKNAYTEAEEEQIKQYFLTNYVTNGYVFHSFPSARQESVEEYGFKQVEKLWDNEKVKEVSEIFERHGVLTALGGFSFYRAGGMYVEHNPENVMFHAFSSPEWFKFFTSSRHTDTNFDINTSPFYLKDYDACKQNVEDLCINANLDEEESKRVIDLFETAWTNLGNTKLVFAMIPRSKINKDSIEQAIIEGESLEDTITTVLTDRMHQFDEHVGNVIDPTQISADDLCVLELPQADKLIECQQFDREKREDLYNPKRVVTQMTKGLLSGVLDVSFEQYVACMDAMDSVFSDNPNYPKEIKRYLEKMDEKIENSTLSKDKKWELINTMRGYERQRQENHRIENERNTLVPDESVEEE